MSYPGPNLSAKEILLQAKYFITGPRTIRGSEDDEEERQHLVIREPPQSLHSLPPLPQLEVWSSPALDLDGIVLLYRCSLIAQEILLSLPSPTRLLSAGDLKLVEKLPVAAGRFTDILEATYDGRRVVLKVYRCYRSFDVNRVMTRFRNEVYICSFLPRADVSLVGAYSTEEYPFGLVYEYMDGMDLRQYIQKEPNVGRLELLTVVARALNRMHDVGIVHGNLETANILIDKDGIAHIGGLGNACIPPTESTHPTKADDMFAFGVVAWEVFTGRPPPPDPAGTAPARSTTSGPRLSRPIHHEVSDIVWRIIESCWHSVASRRMAVGEVVKLLEAELSHISASGA